MSNVTTKNRIKALFEGTDGDILSVFYTAGYPNLQSTVSVGQHLAAAGADIIEIGIPFSDPVADGPTIQASNKVSLDNGMSVKLLLEQVAALRPTIEIPIILMGYLNPVMQYGIEKFCEDASSAGVDGLILPDLPMDEYLTEYKQLFADNDLCNTFLISPTTSDKRIREIDDATNGFIYAVSASSTTGAKGKFSQEQLGYFEKLKSLKLKNPFLIGFGISDHDSFATASSYSSGAIVGSAFINLLQEYGSDAEAIQKFVQNLKRGE